MTIHKYYIGGMGPYLYDDTEPLLDPDGDFPGETQKGMITSGPIATTYVATQDDEVVRLADLSGIIAVAFDDNIKFYFGTGNDVSLYYDGTDFWIKLNEVAPSDLKLDCGINKTLELQHAVWEDLNFDPNAASSAVAGEPDYVTINNVAHREFKSTNNQLCGSGAEVPHSFKLSTTIYPHIHIFLKSGETAGTTGVTFTFYWELRTSGAATSGSVTLSATSAQLTANPNVLTIYDNTGFAGAAVTGAQLAVLISRTAGDAGDVVVTTFGVHFQIDTIGSRQLGTK